jgi:WD40 repeat protein
MKKYTLNPNSLQFFKFETQKQLSFFPSTFAIMHDRICFSNIDGVVRMSDYVNESIEYSHERNHDHFETVTCILGHADDARFLTAGLDGQIKLWDMSNMLVCIINLRSPIMAMCFSNLDGDLVLGLNDKLENLSNQACSY